MTAPPGDPPDHGSIQRIHPSVGAAELAEFAENADGFARLEADKELVHRLSLHGYEGASWRLFARALAEYGLQVMQAWIATGEIFRQCERKGMGGLSSTRRARDDDDVCELAGETVAVAIKEFRDKVLVPAKWDPTRGASLKTFFIGQCVYQFPNVHRRWISETKGESLNTDDVRATMAPQPSITTVVTLRKELEALPLDDARSMKVMIEMGYSQAEIAELIGVTKRSVDSKLYRHNHRKGAAP